MKRTVRSDIGEVTIRENGLVVARAFHDVTLTLQNAKDYHSMVAYLTRSKPHSTVIDISGLMNVEADAKEFLIEQSSNWGKTVALGLITNSFTSRMIGEAFLSDNRPNYPIQVFENMLEAQQWARNEYLKSATLKAS